MLIIPYSIINYSLIWIKFSCGNATLYLYNQTSADHDLLKCSVKAKRRELEARRDRCTGSAVDDVIQTDDQSMAKPFTDLLKESTAL